ncbi:MAG: copper resistance protein CopC [Acidimicrobiia bacterium]
MPARSRLLAVVALAGCASVLRATPASAHAVLLRAEPSPQTTVERPPAAIRLTFSEPVEVAFGAVRVFDVDGNRVDDGAIRRAEGDRQVVLPVSLRNGTYTVTWRVTSQDGHPVRGGFGFFVGAPSTISAVAVPVDEGSGPVVTIGYGMARFLWFAALVTVLGMVAMRRWVWTPAVRAVGMAGSPAADRFRRGFGTALPAAWVVLLVAGAAGLVFQSATVSGLSLAQAARPEVLGELLKTSFGRLWTVQAALAVALGLPVLALVARRPLLGVPPRPWLVAAGVVGAALCVATAANGHARTVWNTAVMVPALSVHLLAAAVWAGGLAALFLLGRTAWRSVGPDQRPPLLRELVRRFGRVGVVAAPVLLGTGAITSFGLLSRVSDLWDVSFGRVVSAKVALFAVAVALAAVHRRRTPRRLDRPDGVARFEQTGAAELLAVTGAIALASVLVALVPGRSLALAAKAPVNQERQAGPYTVQLYVDPTRVGENEFHVTFVNEAGLAAAEVATVEVTLGPAGGDPQPVAMRLISPGHFVGDASLPAPGRYSLAVAGTGAEGATTTFDFRLHPERST